MEGEGEGLGEGFDGDCIIFMFSWFDEVGYRGFFFWDVSFFFFSPFSLTFLNFFQSPPDAFIRSADDVYARDFVRSFLLEVVQGAEGVDAEGVCAAEEDTERFMVF